MPGSCRGSFTFTTHAFSRTALVPARCRAILPRHTSLSAYSFFPRFVVDTRDCARALPVCARSILLAARGAGLRAHAITRRARALRRLHSRSRARALFTRSPAYFPQYWFLPGALVRLFHGCARTAALWPDFAAERQRCPCHRFALTRGSPLAPLGLYTWFAPSRARTHARMAALRLHDVLHNNFLLLTFALPCCVTSLSRSLLYGVTPRVHAPCGLIFPPRTVVVRTFLARVLVRSLRA